jgi:hypothetical protein
VLTNNKDDAIKPAPSIFDNLSMILSVLHFVASPAIFQIRRDPAQKVYPRKDEKAGFQILLFGRSDDFQASLGMVRREILRHEPLFMCSRYSGPYITIDAMRKLAPPALQRQR